MESLTGTDMDEGLVPLIIAVTGHRDLVESEIPRIRDRVRDFFEHLRRRFPDRPLKILSPLAEGADRLVAEVAIDLQIAVDVPLPMPREAYVEDFADEASLAEFNRLLQQARSVYELPVAPGSASERWGEYGDDRNQQYAQLGIFLCAHCHVLLALWDGKPSLDLGGTAQVVRFHHEDVMAGYAPSEAYSQQMLVADDSDLVYHIVVSRNRADGVPISHLRPLSASWFTTDEQAPRAAELPERYARVFELTSRFNRDVRKHQHRIIEEAYSLVDSVAESIAVPGALLINRLFCAADWLAIYYQRRMFSALRMTHAMAFLMGLFYIGYSDIQARRYYMLFFFIFLAAAYLIHFIASKGRWHGKYLEYRALAEGLRVQFYWAMAGVISETSTKFAHDNFLQKQDSDLGWIRNVMRVAGIGCDVRPGADQGGLAYVAGAWIGAVGSGGQLGYFRKKIEQYVEHAGHMDKLGKLISVVVLVFIALSLLVDSNAARTIFLALLGAALLLFGLRESYTHKTAERELIKQYEFMYSIFMNAKRRMEAARDEMERRRVLRVLGESALDEHAEWVLRHRDRPLNRGGLLRMET